MSEKHTGHISDWVWLASAVVILIFGILSLVMGGCQSTSHIEGPSFEAERTHTEPQRYRYEIEIDIPWEPRVPQEVPQEDIAPEHVPAHRGSALPGLDIRAAVLSAAYAIPAPAVRPARSTASPPGRGADDGSLIHDVLRNAPPGSAVRITRDETGPSGTTESVTSRGTQVRTSSDEVASEVSLGGSRWDFGSWFSTDRDASGFSIEAAASHVNFFTILGGLVTLGGIVLIALPPHRWTTGGYLVGGGILMGILGTLFEDHPLVLIGLLLLGGALLWILLQDSRKAADRALALNAIVPGIEKAEKTDPSAARLVKGSIETRAAGPREPRIRDTIRQFKTRNGVS